MKDQASDIKTPRTERPIRWMIGFLLFCTLIGISGRLIFLGTETLAGGDSLWRLSFNITTLTTPLETTLKLFPPLDTPNIRTIQRNLSYPGFKVRKSSGDQKYRRHIHIVANDEGEKNISAEYLMQLSQTPFNSTTTNTSELTTQRRELYLQDEPYLDLTSYKIKETIQKLLITQPNQEHLLDEIYTYLKSYPIHQGKDRQNVTQILKRGTATTYDRTIVMVALCRAIGIPARMVSGLILKDDIEPQPHYWVEAYEDNSWFSYDLHYGYKKSVPINFLPIRRNDKNMVQFNKGSNNQIEFDLEQEFNHPLLRQNNEQSVTSVLDLSRLPLDMRNELALLLLLPLGALITALFRHLLGVHSYGVFTPTLLALAIVYANLMTTLIIFLVVTTLAIGGRSFFPASITRIPRLSIIFTLIAVILTLSVSVLNYFNIDQGGKIILLPIIILTSLVDRFYRTIEDRGLKIALRRMVYTIIIALLCLPVIQFEVLGHLILQYPEIHFTTLAIFLLISLYKGKHLISLPLLKLLAEPESKPKSKKKVKQPDS